MLTKAQIISIVRYIWLIAAAGLILYIISQNVVTSRSLTYSLDFKNPITPNITGWYPESRVFFDQENNSLQLLEEPIYYQVYVPWRGQIIFVKGSFQEYQPGMRLGLRQKDSTWQFEDILSADFELPFDMPSAQIKQNKIEFILAMPDISPEPVILKNNWQIILSQ